MQGQRTTHSRFEVVAAGEQAWAWDGRFRLFRYDGLRFWRHDRKRDSYKLVASWRSPVDGWMHAAGYPCAVCNQGATEVALAAREAAADVRAEELDRMAA